MALGCQYLGSKMLPSDLLYVLNHISQYDGIIPTRIYIKKHTSHRFQEYQQTSCFYNNFVGGTVA